MKYFRLKDKSMYEVNAIEYIFKEADEQYLILIIPEKFLIMGKYGLYEYFKKEKADELGVKLWRGQFDTTKESDSYYYLDENQVGCFYIMNSTNTREEQMAALHNWMLKSLKDLGVTATTRKNDVIIGDKKIGSLGGVDTSVPGKVMGGMGLTLVMDYDIPEQCAEFKHDIREGSIGINQCGYNITVEELTDSLEKNFNLYFPQELEESEINENLQNEIDELIPSLNSENWLKYGELTEAEDFTDKLDDL